MLSFRSTALRRPLSQLSTRSARTGLRSVERHPFQRGARRGYAEGHGEAKQAGSDIPWMLGAVGATAGGLAYLQPWKSTPHAGALSNSLESHGGSHHEEHDEDSEEPEDKSEEGEKSEDKSDEGEEAGDSGEKQGEGEEGSDDAKKSKEGSEKKSKDNSKGDAKKKDGSSKPKGEQKKESSDKSDAGEKKGKGQGAAGDEDANSKGSQKGVSNTPTKHSTDQTKNPDQSKKEEGAPESAKVPAPVKPDR